MPGGFNGTQQIIDIPAGTAYFNILATGPVRRLRITESTLTSTGTANTPVGLNYKVPNDGSANGFTTVFNTLPPNGGVSGDFAYIDLGDNPGDHAFLGSILGNGPGMIIGIGATPATILCKVTSATGAATSVQVRQDY